MAKKLYYIENLTSRLKKGKYKGIMVATIIAKDARYLLWIRNNVPTWHFSNEINATLNKFAKDHFSSLTVAQMGIK